MQRSLVLALVASVVGIVPALAEPMPLHPDYYSRAEARRSVPAHLAPQPQPAPTPVVSAPAAAAPARYAAAEPRDLNLGGGFIEFLFGGGRPVATPRPPSEMTAHGEPYAQPEAVEPRARQLPDPKFEKQVVPYHGAEKPGTVIIDTPQRFLFLVQENGTAMRYGIGVGREGFQWQGLVNITRKAEWPDWTPPPEMIARQPYLPRWMAGGPGNPLGARAMYLGSTIYRIHGTNQPQTIGSAVSSGCFRLVNDMVVDLYDRVPVGTKVIIRHQPAL